MIIQVENFSFDFIKVTHEGQRYAKILRLCFLFVLFHVIDCTKLRILKQRWLTGGPLISWSLVLPPPLHWNFLAAHDRVGRTVESLGPETNQWILLYKVKLSLKLIISGIQIGEYILLYKKYRISSSNESECISFHLTLKLQNFHQRY